MPDRRQIGNENKIMQFNKKTTSQTSLEKSGGFGQQTRGKWPTGIQTLATNSQLSDVIPICYGKSENYGQSDTVLNFIKLICP